MTRTLRLLALLLISIALVSCQRNIDNEARRAQAQLDEAGLLIDSRNFDKAEQSAIEAMSKIETLLSKQPDNVDFKLLRIRARFTIFMTRNILILEDAAIRAKSLVRFPKAEALKDYDSTLKIAEQELQAILQGPVPLNFDQTAYAQSTLASIYRLKLDTIQESINHYNLAIAAYKQELDKLAKDTPDPKARKYTTMGIEHKISTLQQAQAEVYLLAENWSSALQVLESTMAGKDLKYFDVRFDLLEGQISTLTNRVCSDEGLSKGSRERKLVESLKEARKGRELSQLERLGAENPYHLELLHTKVQRDEAQNNLSYRIICYYQLKDQNQLGVAREILRKHYPELDEKLYSLLQANP